MSVTVNLTQLKRKKRVDGTIPIYIRITENRKSRYKSTGISVKPSEWNDKNQSVSKSHPKSEHLNVQLDKQLREIGEIKEGLYKKDRLSMDAVVGELKGESDPRSILHQCRAYREYLKEDRYWEWKHFGVLIGNLTDYIESSRKPDQLDLLNSSWIEGFQEYLQKEVGNSNNTTRKKLQRLKGLTDWMLKKKILKADPFLGVDKVQRKKTASKVKLSSEQIESIKNLDLEQGSDLWHVRNYFLFSFYNAGIRFGDLCTLTWNNIVDGRLVYKMHKTGGQKNIKQLEPMLEILAHYKPEREGYIFPILDKVYTNPVQLRRRISSKNVQVNNRLKTIAEMAGIQSNVSFHVSRHSFAHYALKKGIDLYSISKALGHSDLQVTEEYIKSFDEELLDKAMEGLYE